MAEKKWWNNPWTCGVGGCCFGCVAIPLVMAGVFGIGIVGLVSQSGIYEDAAELARTHPAVVARLGEPVETGFPRDVHINLGDNEGQAKLRLPVSGPNGSGMLYVEARKVDGKWEYRKLDLNLDDSLERIDLLTARGPLEAPEVL